MFAMRRQCALLGIRDSALQCRLLDTFVLPILRYGAEVWGVQGSTMIDCLDMVDIYSQLRPLGPVYIQLWPYIQAVCQDCCLLS